MRVLAAVFVILGVIGMVPPGMLTAQGSRATIGAGAAVFAVKFGSPIKDFGAAKFYIACEGSESGAKWGITFKGDKATGIQRSACGAEPFDASTVKRVPDL
jgi:hypothetical protein